MAVEAKTLYVLGHLHKYPDGTNDDKLIGIFTNQKEADQAKAQYLKLDGFDEYPLGFYLQKLEVDSIDQNALKKLENEE